MDKLSKCILAAVTAAGIGALWASRADAQTGPTCLPTKDMTAMAHELGMVETSFGILSPQTAFVIYSTPDGAVWSAVVVGTDGTSCVIADGADWFPGALAPSGEPA